MAKAPQVFETLSDTYSVIEIIGEGGSGRVFAVKDSSGEMFALKCLFPQLSTAQKRKRFKNEVDFCSKQEHPNLIQVEDSGIVDWDNVKTPFYVMPLLPQTLRKLLEQKVPPERALPLFSQILNGVEAAHLLGVIHRDLKPENMLYDPARGRIVIADFGIAHFEEELLATTVATKPGDKLANLCYSAPEQRTRGAKVDHRADIYALGLILNEMYTGEVPQGAGYMKIGHVVPECAYLDQLVERMIQQAPNARPSSLQEVKQELIGRRNELVALQELDAKRRAVVPTNTPGQVLPVHLIGCDWNHGTLTLHLDHVPEQGWIQRFQQPRGSFSFIGGAEPASFRFSGNTATVRADERMAQQVINNFKQFLEMATRGYQEEINARAAKMEQEQRRKLEIEVADAEKRARVLRGLKI